MDSKHNCLIILSIFIFFEAFSLGPIAIEAEEPSYSVLETDGDFELREYSSYIVAETYLEGNFDEVGSDGFRRLADYIGGKNKKRTTISMTAPVSQSPESEKIEMTSPVSQERENHRWRITFMMPSSYTMKTLPLPDDDRISLREEKPKIVAVIRYAGTWGKKRYEERKEKLMNWIIKRGWEQIGEPVWARYDPPFMPYFLRRNEIFIPVNIQ